MLLAARACLLTCLLVAAASTSERGGLARRGGLYGGFGNGMLGGGSGTGGVIWSMFGYHCVVLCCLQFFWCM